MIMHVAEDGDDAREKKVIFGCPYRFDGASENSKQVMNLNVSTF